MRFLILNTDYPEFQYWFYAQYPGLETLSYEETLRVRVDCLFGDVGFYSANLCNLGYEAYDIVANNEFIQKTWALEHGVKTEKSSAVDQLFKTVLPYARRIASWVPFHHLNSFLQPIVGSLVEPSWFYDVLAAQIKHYKPDVLLNLDVHGIRCKFLREMRPYLRLLVGQHAATKLSGSEEWGCYDLVLSSFPPTIDWFRQKGISAELLRLGFEPRVLSLVKAGRNSFDLTFVGSFFSVHSSRVELLEVLCGIFDQIKIWGPRVDHLPSDSLIRSYYMGQAWGREMYQIFCDSRITLNHHGDIPPYANNCRLFEATGSGAMLITDWKENLHEMFEPDKEVVAYRNTEECVELIQYYLENDQERKAIANAGQQRTLREHTYYQRMKEFLDIIRRYI